MNTQNTHRHTHTLLNNTQTHTQTVLTASEAGEAAEAPSEISQAPDVLQETKNLTCLKKLKKKCLFFS